MAEYDETKLTKLGALKALAERVKQDYTTKEEHTTLSKKVEELVTTGGEPNKIEKIKVNGTEQSISSADKSVNIEVPTTVEELTDSEKYATKEEVKSQISATYKPGGSYVFASLPAAVEANVGMVYNVTDSFTTTDSFLEGAGNDYPAGTNVVVINDDSTYKYDVLAGFVDLTGYVEKVSGKQLSSNDYTNEDKEKLQGLENYTHPKYTSQESGLYKITVDATGHVSAVTKVTKTDITELNIPGQDTTYKDATQSEHGLMSTVDKIKLDNIDFATDEEVKAVLDEIFGASA